MCLKFDQEASKPNHFSSWFLKDTKQINTRRQLKQIKEAQARTARLDKSALPHMTRILNSEYMKHPNAHHALT